MTYASPNRTFLRTLSVLFIALLIITMLPVSAFAAETNEEYIELDGSFTGRFELNSNTTKLFHLEDIAPGDQWSGTIHVKNTCPAAMEFAIVSVISKLEDTVLFDALVSHITVDGEVVYDDTYGFSSSEEYMTKFYVVEPDQTIDIGIVVTLPADVGNSVMNKSMDSKWIFEARYYGASYVVRYEDEDGNPLAPSKPGHALIGETVVEEAIEIEGYKPDQNRKSLVILEEDNVIIFVYSPETDNPQTGDPMYGILPWISAVFIISMIALMIVVYREVARKCRQK